MTSEYIPSLDQARSLAGQGNLIAVHRELPADMETPVSVYLKLRGAESDRGGLSFLLESVEKGEQLGRYSFIGVHPPMTVVSHGQEVIIGGAGGTVLERKTGDPLSIVQELLAGRVPVDMPGLPRFTGGVVGYFGYDLVRFMEKLPATANHDLMVPDMALLFCDNLVVFDFIRPDVAQEILELMVRDVLDGVHEQGISITLGASGHKALTEVGLKDLSNGGRGIRNKVETHLVNPLARALFDVGATTGDAYEITDLVPAEVTRLVLSSAKSRLQ